MPSVGFRLYADTTALERGLAEMDSSTGKLKSAFGNLGGLLRGTFAATAVYALIKAHKDAIERAQAHREKMLALGQAVDLNTAAVARYGDALKALKTGAIDLVMGALTKSLGLYTRAGANIGEMGVYLFKGEKGMRNIETSEAAEAKRVSLERGMGAAKELGEFREKTTMEEAAPEQKINLLLADNIRLYGERAKFERGTKEYDERQLAIEKNNAELRKVDAAIQKKTAEDAEKSGKTIAEQIERQIDLLDQKHEAEADVSSRRGALETAQADRGKMTLEELASVTAFGVGTGSDARTQSSTARSVLDLQQKAEEARSGGRADEAIGLLSRADELKAGLSALKSTDREDPLKAYKEALAESEKRLASIDSKLGGTEP
jgi:hypothetical protein